MVPLAGIRPGSGCGRRPRGHTDVPERAVDAGPRSNVDHVEWTQPVEDRRVEPLTLRIHRIELAVGERDQRGAGRRIVLVVRAKAWRGVQGGREGDVLECRGDLDRGLERQVMNVVVRQQAWRLAIANRAAWEVEPGDLVRPG